MTFDELAEELVHLFRRGADAPLDDDVFDRHARRVFRFQFERNPVYGAFCRRRGMTPDRLDHWREIPPVPTRAFKHLRLVSGRPERVEAVFRTSGTSKGPGSRGEHVVRDLHLYRESLLPNFRTNLLPDGAHLPLVSLIPSPEEVPDSSLSHMVGVVDERLAAPGGGYFVDPEEGLDEGPLLDVLSRVEREERPVLLMATAFSVVHCIDALDRRGRRFRLAPGTRMMETGGYKGRSRELGREELYAGIGERLGVPADRIVNEYGMTELLSQFYEPVLRNAGEDPDADLDAGDDLASRRHRPPPWVRTRVLDPTALEPVEPGELGLLCHLDLANLGSVSAVLTEDVGVRSSGGFRVLGRAEDAEPRGCSLAMDELLAASGS